METFELEKSTRMRFPLKVLAMNSQLITSSLQVFFHKHFTKLTASIYRYSSVVDSQFYFLKRFSSPNITRWITMRTNILSIAYLFYGNNNLVAAPNFPFHFEVLVDRLLYCAISSIERFALGALIS